jgi:hypothetical protein
VKHANDKSPTKYFTKKGSKAAKEETSSDIRDIRIPGVEHSFSPSKQRYHELIQPEPIDTDKFISFSAKQNKNFDVNRSPKKHEIDIQRSIKNYSTAIKNLDSVILQ